MGVTMDYRQILTDGYGRVGEVMEETLNGLTESDLDWQPNPDSNSMGWLAWHLTRVQDDHIADLMGEEQLWISEAWHARFNRPPSPADVGWGHSSGDVAAFKSPPAEVLVEYHRAVLARTRQYISMLSEGDLDRELDEPQFQPLPTVGVRLVSVMSDNLQHVGQVAYLRGLRKSKGWLGY